MKKEVLENALSQVDDYFMEEALEYGKNKNGKIVVFSAFGRFAAAMVLLVGITGLGTLAYEKLIKDVKVEDGMAYVGDYAYWVTDEPLEGEEHIHDPEYEVISITKGDETTGWLEKKVEKAIPEEDGCNKDDKRTTYTYATYEEAAAFLKLEKRFTNLPGKELRILAVDARFGSGFHMYTVNGLYQYNKGSFYIYQLGFSNNVDFAEDAFYEACITDIENERKYRNKNGVEFTLVDGIAFETVDDFCIGGKTKITSVIICTDDNFGEIRFSGLKDSEIHEILDCFSFEK